jgi:hypothetical protein
MTIEIITDRSPHKAASTVFLQAHIDYLSDPNHPDHKGKVEIHPPKFYNLKNPTTVGFLKAVTDADDSYLKFRDGMTGKRTSDIWDESIYRTPDNTDLSVGERTTVELTMLSIRPGTPAFMQWHYNHTRGSWDLHVLTSNKSTDWPPRVILSSLFGAGKKNIYAEMDYIDDDLVYNLNLHRGPDNQIVSKLERKKKKALIAIGEKPSLAQEIAGITKQVVTRANLVDIVRSLGHQVARPPKGEARYLSVIYRGRKQTRRNNIEDLLAYIADIQHDIKIPAIEPGAKAPAIPPSASAPSLPPITSAPTDPPITGMPAKASASPSTKPPGTTAPVNPPGANTPAIPPTKPPDPKAPAIPPDTNAPAIKPGARTPAIPAATNPELDLPPIS